MVTSLVVYFMFSLVLLSVMVLMASYSMALHALSLFMISVLMSCFLGVYYSTFLGSLMMLAYASGLLVLLAYFVCLCANQFVSMNSVFWGVWLVLNSFYFFVSGFPSMGHSVVVAAPSHLMLLSSDNKMLLVSVGLMLLLTMVCVIKVVCNSSGPMRTWKVVEY